MSLHGEEIPLSVEEFLDFCLIGKREGRGVLFLFFGGGEGL